MIPYIRRQKILDELEKTDIIYVKDLIEKFEDVSESTIRRDLKTLQDQGQIVLLHGGAAKLKVDSYDVPVTTKQLMQVHEKERIARHAASLVKHGEVIYIDSGTTTERMIKHLKNKKITIITSSIQVINDLLDTDITCIITGGEVIKSLASIVGPMTDSILQNLYFDKSFIGASGYSGENGISTPDIREANKKRIVQENSKKCYVLVDSSKANKIALCKAFNLDECIIITDAFNKTLKEYEDYIIAP